MARSRPDILTFEEIAKELRFAGKDAKRFVERRFKKYEVDYIPSIGATADQFGKLLEAISCSPSAIEATSGTVAERSVLGRKSEKSKNTLQAALNEKMQKNTETSIPAKSGRNSLAVLQGGRS